MWWRLVPTTICGACGRRWSFLPGRAVLLNDVDEAPLTSCDSVSIVDQTLKRGEAAGRMGSIRIVGVDPGPEAAERAWFEEKSSL
jgi:hypothetical protein